MALHCGTHQMNYLALYLRMTRTAKALSSAKNQLLGGSSIAWLPSKLASVNGHVTVYKVQIFMCKPHTMQTFLTLALHRGEREATGPACFIPRERHHKTTE